MQFFPPSHAHHAPSHATTRSTGHPLRFHHLDDLIYIYPHRSLRVPGSMARSPRRNSAARKSAAARSFRRLRAKRASAAAAARRAAMEEAGTSAARLLTGAILPHHAHARSRATPPHLPPPLPSAPPRPSSPELLSAPGHSDESDSSDSEVASASSGTSSEDTLPVETSSTA